MISPLRKVESARTEDATTRPIRAIQARHRTSPVLERNCFEFVEPVLDRLYADLGDAKADESIARALADLTDEYGNGDKSKIDYSEPVRRFAYLYRHMPVRVYAFDEILSKAYEVRQLFNRSPLKLSSIGGGPGSDILAALRRAARGNKRARIDATILDRESTWQQTWDSVSGVWGCSMRATVKYRPFDMTQPLQRPMLRTIRATRLFTFSYCLSEVPGGLFKARRFFESLVAAASPGAYFVVMDNQWGQNGSPIRWIDGFAHATGLHRVIPVKDARIEMHDTEYAHSYRLRSKYHLDASRPECNGDRGFPTKGLSLSYTILRKP